MALGGKEEGGEDFQASMVRMAGQAGGQVKRPSEAVSGSGEASGGGKRRPIVAASAAADEGRPIGEAPGG